MPFDGRLLLWLIGIGRGLAASPRPHHRTYGSRLRRCGRLSQGYYTHPHLGVISRRASGQFIPGVGPSGQRLAIGHLAAPEQATTPLHRAGLQHAPRAPTMPSTDFCGAVREDSSALSPLQGHTADLPGPPSSLLGIGACLIKHTPLWMEDFAVPCQLVPSVPPLVSGACPSPRTFAPRCLQTPPRGDALAVHFSFGLTRLNRGLVPPSVKTCPAHTLPFSGAPRAARPLQGPVMRPLQGSDVRAPLTRP